MLMGRGMPMREVVWVTALFVVLTVVLAYPLSAHPGTMVLPLGGDTRLFLWTIGWDVHALTHRPWAVFDANIFAPERLTLAYSENCIGSAIVAAPFLWLTRNHVLALNAVVLLSCVLCGVGTYALARQLGVSRSGSVIAGVIFAFAPPRFLRLGQLHLAPVQWVPFCLMYLHRYLEEGRSRDVKIAAAFFVLQVVTSGHGGLFLIVCMLSLAAWRLLRREPLRLAALPRDLGFTGAALLVLVFLMTWPYMVVQREQGLRRTLQDARAWAPNLASYLASPSSIHRAVLGWFPAPPGPPKAVLFPGLLPLALAPFGIWAAWRSPQARPWAGYYVLMLLVSVWLTLGPDYGLYALAYHLPAANFIRVPSRYMTLALLALGVMAAAGFDLLASRLTGRVRLIVASLVVIWLSAEFSVMPLNAIRYEMDIPGVDRWLGNRPEPFTIAELPVLDPANQGPAASRQSFYMVHSMAHWQKTVNGYSGHEPLDHTRLYKRLVNFPDARSLAALDRFGVDYIVVHTTYYLKGEWEQVLARLPAYSSRLTLLYNDGEARVYALKRQGR